MLSRKQSKAVKLLFQKTEEEVAAEIDVKLEMIEKWKSIPEFRKALIEEGQAIRAAAARITSEASLTAARNLRRLLSDAKDGKLALETLKASGAFEEKKTDKEEALDGVLQEVADVDETQV